MNDMMKPKLLVSELGKIRWWFEGFEAGGGKLPHGLEALRQAQVIFDELDKKGLTPYQYTAFAPDKGED